MKRVIIRNVMVIIVTLFVSFLIIYSSSLWIFYHEPKEVEPEIIETEKKVTVKVTQKVTVNQKKIIEAIKENPNITQEKLAEIIGISRKSIIANMKHLQENGFIKRIGADKNGYWQVVSNIFN